MEPHMARKRHKPEEIIARLRQVGVLTRQSNGPPAPAPSSLVGWREWCAQIARSWYPNFDTMKNTMIRQEPPGTVRNTGEHKTPL